MKDTILLVDDEEDIRDVLSIALSALGYNPISASNGTEALRIFREQTPRIVLTDIKMPGMDGISLLKKIKHENPETEVIMITGHGDMALAIESFKDAAADFITKPVDIDALTISINRAQEKIAIRQQLHHYTENLEQLVLKKTTELSEGKKHDRLSPLPGIDAEREASFQSLIDRLPCYIVLQNKGLNYTAANRKFREEYGNIISANCYSVCKQQQKSCGNCPVLETFQDGNSHQVEMTWRKQTGEQYPVLVWTAPLHDAGGTIQQVFTMATSIDDILNIQDHLASLGLLIGSASHGIKGLLTGLDAGMYILDSGVEKDNKELIQEGLDTVKAMSGRIKQMVMDVLFYAKERNIKAEQVDVIAFAIDLAGTVLPKAEEKGVAFVEEFPEAAGVFEIDSGFVHAAMVNILENAIEACASDTAKGKHRVVFSVKPEKEFVLFDVSDNGVGMDPQTRARMFDLFFSLKDKKGTGMGLFITQKIVKQHNGTIDVVSEKGKGTRMSVRLPRRLEDQAAT